MVIYNLIILKIIIFISLYEFLIHKYTKVKRFNISKEYQIISSNNNIQKIKNANCMEAEYSNKTDFIIHNSLNYTPKISVILTDIVENNLSESLKSILKQSLKEIEIICIVDYSKYNIINILKKISIKDKRIGIIIKKNINSGIARNVGLSYAKGKYLYIMDSTVKCEINMLKKMYEEIEKDKSDIIICKFKISYINNVAWNEEIINNNFSFYQFNETNPFNVFQISKDIFQFFESWTWDKLFRKDFIISNNINFQNIPNYYDNQFTFLGLCMAKSISTIQDLLVIKNRAIINNDPNSLIFSFDKIKSELENKDLYNLVKESFWKWSLKLFLIQLKYSDKNLKDYLYIKLHQKLNLLDYIDKSYFSSNQYDALHYLKYQKSFPNINIAYVYNRNNIQLLLLSLVSVLKNSQFETINIFIIYNDLNKIDLKRIYELKDIYYFNIHTLKVSDKSFIDFPKYNGTIKEIWYKYILSEKLDNTDKILYLHSNTIIRKSLLPLWEISLNDKLLGAVEDISFSKEKAKMANLIDNYYFNTGVLLINVKECRKIKLFKKANFYIKKYKNIFDLDSTILNIITDTKKIYLNPDYNYMEEIEGKYNCQYNKDFLEIYLKRNPTIYQYNSSKYSILKNNNSFINDYLKYESILNSFKDTHLTIPIVLSSDDKYALYTYTTMISILKNKNKNTFYVFYLLVPLNFSKNNVNIILSIYETYNCYINFIKLDDVIFNHIKMHIKHITKTTYYRLLIAELLPIEIDKCIYLDVDICVCKDLSELFNIDMKDNYLAGVISPAYFFARKKNCKRLNISSMNQYLNAGMLIMNLKQIRKDNMTEKFIELSKRNYFSQDQDVLNVGCFGKIITLPPKYNAQVAILMQNSPLLRKIFSEKEIIEANFVPYIIHYSNNRKPWNYVRVYMEQYWWNIAKKIPYYKAFFTRDNIYKKEIKKLWSLQKKKQLNLESPRTFDDKIQWLKIYDSTPIKTILSDKYLVRDWITEKIGNNFLIPLIGTYNKFTEIDFDKLPSKFVIKCNHGNGYNIIVTDKDRLNLTEVKIKIDKWMTENYAFKSNLELQFRDIQPKIIIEKYINNKNDELKNYELFCFKAKHKLILKDKNSKLYYMINYYDLYYNKITSKFNIDYYNLKTIINHKYIEKIIELASILSVSFNFVKIDFYLINSKIYFNKLGFSTSNTNGDIISKNLYRIFSSSIKLPNLVYNIDTGYYYELSKSISLIPYIMFLNSLFFKLLFNIYIYVF